MDSYRWFLIAHVVAGSVALLAFWTAAALRKGTPLHRRVGQAYLWTMLVVLASGVPLSMAMVERGNPVMAMFLCYLLLITGNACWGAWRAIRDRGHRERYFGAMYWIFAGVVGASGMGIFIMGMKTGAPLLLVFGALGAIGLVDAFAQWRRAPQDPRWWLRQHFSAMIGCGVAVHVAFVGIGLRGAFAGLNLQLVQYLAWFGPLLVAVMASVWIDRRYGRPEASPRLPKPDPGAPQLGVGAPGEPQRGLLREATQRAPVQCRPTSQPRSRPGS